MLRNEYIAFDIQKH